MSVISELYAIELPDLILEQFSWQGLWQEDQSRGPYNGPY